MLHRQKAIRPSNYFLPHIALNRLAQFFFFHHYEGQTKLTHLELYFYNFIAWKYE